MYNYTAGFYVGEKSLPKGKEALTLTDPCVQCSLYNVHYTL